MGHDFSTNHFLILSSPYGSPVRTHPQKILTGHACSNSGPRAVPKEKIEYRRRRVSANGGSSSDVS